MKVYMLCTYQEDGPEEIRATLDPSKLIEMVKSYPWVTNEAEVLSKIISGGKLEESGGVSLSKGWGGLMLSIVELQ